MDKELTQFKGKLQITEPQNEKKEIMTWAC